MPSLTLLALSPPLFSAALAAAVPTPVPVPPATPQAWNLAAAQEIPPQAALPPQSSPPAPSDPSDPDAEPPIGEIVVEGDYGPPAADPMERINEDSYRITQAVDQAFVEPLAYAYRDGLPGPIRDGLSNAVRNLGEPSNALNFLLQGKVGKAFGTLGRLAINSTLGLGGLIDIAGKPGIGLPYRRNGFANTMGYYGVGPGPYLYLPVTGATSARDVIGNTLDQLLLPIAVGKPFNQIEFAVPYFVINGLDARLDVDAELAEIRATDDPYGVRRDTYLARRAREIAALKGETIPEPEADKAEPAGDLPPQSNLSLPERLQLTAGATPAGR